jgi:3-hydroxyacyl-CoA dehydrogenase/enoyl-CoA hydratase/3-hydroxybutyryl-CoA epimerase
VSHWREEIANDVATLRLDVAGQSANVLSREVISELDHALTGLESKQLKGLIIESAKSSGFIAGADVREFEKISDPARAAELARAAQLVFNRLAQLPYPSVALIHGFCLGGGLELALACTYRVAREDASTRLGLPEVRLGIHPGFAGTVRLPKLIGHIPALDLMLTGRSVSAREARRLGLVDEAVPERHALNAARFLLEQRPARAKPRLRHRLPGWAPLRPVVARMLEKRLRGKVNREHYPAPYRMLELWRRRANQEQEALSLGELLVSRTSRNLVHIFLIGEALKRKGRDGSHDIERVHVIGAGAMGADIAMWAAHRGFFVSLHDQNAKAIAGAMKRAQDFFVRRLREPRAVQEALDRLMPDIRGSGVRRADLIIEAIVEKVDAKRTVFQKIESEAPPHAVLATNTSSIPLEEIAKVLRDPTRLVGLHFFNPVAKMQLVEIVRGEQTSEAILDRARAWTVAIDRLPLDVKSSPGFLVNRVLMPYLIESVRLLEEGVPGPQIDKAARNYGMPMGPIELADTVGLDICLSVAEVLSGPLNTPVPDLLRKQVELGRLGRKTQQGFYQYDDRGKAKKRRAGKTTDIPITERLILRLLNEAMACLREHVVSDTDAIDAGMVFGTGFAPYLGGPMRYAESLGQTGISHSLYRLAQEYGNRFEPDPGWSQVQMFMRQSGARA